MAQAMTEISKRIRARQGFGVLTASPDRIATAEVHS